MNNMQAFLLFMNYYKVWQIWFTQLFIWKTAANGLLIRKSGLVNNLFNYLLDKAMFYQPCLNRAIRPAMYLCNFSHFQAGLKFIYQPLLFLVGPWTAIV